MHIHPTVSELLPSLFEGMVEVEEGRCRGPEK
jgi:hypothetical protein